MNGNQQQAFPPPSPLTSAERKRYHRQIILSEVGELGQQKLKSAKVAIFGLGGLGAPCATYLAAAGVGHLTLVDHDEVDLSNLHRQVLFTEEDLGREKTQATLERMVALNPNVEIVAINLRADSGNVRELIADHDIVVDCTDNFRARFAINDACAASKTPLVQASILQFEAQLSVFCSRGGPCYRCLYPEAPPVHIAPSCSEAGVIGVLPGILGTYQASEVLKLILDVGNPLIGRLAVISVLENRFDSLAITADPDCAVCSGTPAAADAKRTTSATAPEPEDEIDTIDAQALHCLIRSRDDLQIVDVRSPEERHEQGWIEHDLSIPLPNLPDNLARLERDRPVICYCVSGQRSRQAVRFLIKSGFSNVRSLNKGIMSWNEPVTSAWPGAADGCMPCEPSAKGSNPNLDG